MSLEQRETLDRMLRQAPLGAGGDVREQRRMFQEVLGSQPLPAGVTVTPAALGAVPTAEITVAGVEPRHIVLYFHLAPEHPYPAAVDDAVAAYEALLDRGVAAPDIVLAGESAGGGLAVATLVAARDRGLPMPAAALLMSPWADLTLTGASMDTKQGVDPLLSRDRFLPAVADYVGGHDPSAALISPVFADLSGLPPLVIQAGSHEVLLDDAVRLAGRAAADDVAVMLDITQGVPHVFQAYHAVLEEGGAALDRAAQLLSDLFHKE